MPETEQFAYWRDVVCEGLVPVSPTRRATGSFTGSLATWRAGPMHVSRVAAEPVTAARTPEQIDRTGGDLIFLNLQTAGGGAAHQAGRAAVQRPGDIVLIDSTQPFRLAFGGEWRQVCVALPIALMQPRVASWSTLTAVTIPGDAGLGALIAAQLSALARIGPWLDQEAARSVARQIVELAALTLGRSASSRTSSSRIELLQAALDYAGRRLDDHELTPTEVALHLHISTRYLHALFADLGISFKRWVLLQRLERWHADLACRALDHLSIGELSLRHGFVDRTHFGRAFRARYGIAPSAERVRSEALSLTARRR